MFGKSLKKTVTKSDKPVAFVSDGLDLSKMVHLVNEEQLHNFKYITAVTSKYEPPKVKHIIDADSPDDEADFEGDYLGEVELRMTDLSVDSMDSISYTSEVDLNKKIIDYMKDHAVSTVEMGSNSPLLTAVMAAEDYLYDTKLRGGVNTIVCSPKFLSKHPVQTHTDHNIIVVQDILPDDIAITNYIHPTNTADVSILAHIDDVSKTVKIKDLNSYVMILKEV